MKDAEETWNWQLRRYTRGLGAGLGAWVYSVCVVRIRFQWDTPHKYKSTDPTEQTFSPLKRTQCTRPLGSQWQLKESYSVYCIIDHRTAIFGWGQHHGSDHWIGGWWWKMGVLVCFCALHWRIQCTCVFKERNYSRIHFVSHVRGLGQIKSINQATQSMRQRLFFY